MIYENVVSIPKEDMYNVEPPYYIGSAALDGLFAHIYSCRQFEIDMYGHGWKIPEETIMKSKGYFFNMPNEELTARDVYMAKYYPDHQLLITYPEWEEWERENLADYDPNRQLTDTVRAKANELVDAIVALNTKQSLDIRDLQDYIPSDNTNTK